MHLIGREIINSGKSLKAFNSGISESNGNIFLRVEVMLSLQLDINE